jgi:hypothetical protein
LYRQSARSLLTFVVFKSCKADGAHFAIISQGFAFLFELG